MASDLKLQTFGRDKESDKTVADMKTVQAIISDWNAMSKKSANLTIEQYGLPNEATPSRLVWYNNGPWKRTIIYRDEIPHDFPQPHTDVIENVIDYRVPPEMFSEVAKFDGSVIVERTAGEVSSRCDMEAANIVALNFMHDIVTGKLNAEKAREDLSEINTSYLMNKSAPYAEALQFSVAAEDTNDTDHVTVEDEIIKQGIEKVNDVMKGDKDRRGDDT